MSRIYHSWRVLGALGIFLCFATLSEGKDRRQEQHVLRIRNDYMDAPVEMKIVTKGEMLDGLRFYTDEYKIDFEGKVFEKGFRLRREGSKGNKDIWIRATPISFDPKKEATFIVRPTWGKATYLKIEKIDGVWRTFFKDPGGQWLSASELMIKTRVRGLSWSVLGYENHERKTQVWALGDPEPSLDAVAAGDANNGASTRRH